MLQLIQNILMAVIGGISSAVAAKWLDSIWTKRKAKHDTLPTSLENTIDTKKQSFYKQINERVFLSQWTYYYVTMLWFYCTLALSYIIVFYYSKYTHHPIQDNFLSNVAFEYVRGTVTPSSVIFIVLLYPIVNSVSIIVELVMRILKKMNVSFSKSTVQQIRMMTTMIASVVLSIFLAYSIY
ncbi:hypothetical protein A8135_01745 [Legionella jamestowniensis]|uniref:Integral membrane protein n=1 Tax=Legionella jamestowniensis TaxID=455 RepID=A0ABX2Y196_9GAMM|nr:hypothetical protein [Legionella jamestowniensis]OCH97970.1 hypothetical protein A8135_01745 [Legionella jamestowniensis]